MNLILMIITMFLYSFFAQCIWYWFQLDVFLTPEYHHFLGLMLVWTYYKTEYLSFKDFQKMWDEEEAEKLLTKLMKMLGATFIWVIAWVIKEFMF